MENFDWTRVFGAGGLLTVVAAVVGTVLQHRSTVKTSEKTAEVALAVRESEEELGYVDRLQVRVTALEQENRRLYDINQELVIRATHADDRIMEVVRYAAWLETKHEEERSVLIADLLMGTPIAHVVPPGPPLEPMPPVPMMPPAGDEPKSIH